MAHISSSLESFQENTHWDQCFLREEGWLGADVARSVPLRDGRTLWLFGDTFVGHKEDAEGGPKYNDEVKLTYNTLGVHPTPSEGQTPDQVDFYFDAEKPFVKPSGEGWYWPMGAAHQEDDGSLMIFAPKLDNIQKQENITIPWNFKYVEGHLWRVKDPEGSPKDWKVETLAVPHSKCGEEGDLLWGAEVIRWGAYLYIFGVQKLGDFDKRLVLARTQGRLDDFDSWSFLGPEGFTSSTKDLTPLVTDMVDEFSLFEWRGALYLIQSEALLGKRVLVRRADFPQGPWSDAVEVARVEVDHPSHYGYAAKAHLSLSKDGEVLVSYLQNSHDLDLLLKQADVYRPRFFSLSLEEIDRTLDS